MEKVCFSLFQSGEIALCAEVLDKALTLVCLRQNTEVLRLPMCSFF